MIANRLLAAARCAAVQSVSIEEAAGAYGVLVSHVGRNGERGYRLHPEHHPVCGSTLNNRFGEPRFDRYLDDLRAGNTAAFFGYRHDGKPVRHRSVSILRDDFFSECAEIERIINPGAPKRKNSRGEEKGPTELSRDYFEDLQKLCSEAIQEVVRFWKPGPSDPHSIYPFYHNYAVESWCMHPEVFSHFRELATLFPDQMRPFHPYMNIHGPEVRDFGIEPSPTTRIRGEDGMAEEPDRAGNRFEEPKKIRGLEL